MALKLPEGWTMTTLPSGAHMAMVRMQHMTRATQPWPTEQEAIAEAWRIALGDEATRAVANAADVVGELAAVALRRFAPSEAKVAGFLARAASFVQGAVEAAKQAPPQGQQGPQDG